MVGVYEGGAAMIETLATIDAPGQGGFNCGIVLWDDVVVEAPPIVKYMARKKWSRSQVRNYCKERGWTVSVVYQMERAK